MDEGPGGPTWPGTPSGPGGPGYPLGPKYVKHQQIQKERAIKHVLRVQMFYLEVPADRALL